MNLTANYTVKNLNALISDESLYRKLIGDPNRTGFNKEQRLVGTAGFGLAAPRTPVKSNA